MEYNPRLHHRRSIRLKNYDYSLPGFYFVTVCIQNHEYLLGEINKDKMVLNDAGKIIYKWYLELENKFKDIKCHEMIIMPNHFHCIIENVATQADLCVEPIVREDICVEPIVGADLCVCPKKKGEHVGSPLHRVVQWFKTMTTNEYIRGVKQYGWRRFKKRLWQRNYWEHIIRNENQFIEISNYINNNPLTWKNDKLNGGYDIPGYHDE